MIDDLLEGIGRMALLAGVGAMTGGVLIILDIALRTVLAHWGVGNG
jgi:hypothetical protein